MENSIAISLNRMIRRAALIGMLFVFCGSVMANGKVLIIRGETESFQQVVEGLTGDLEGEVEFQSQLVSDKTNASVVKNLLAKDPPDLVILIGNHAINAYAKYQKANRTDQFPPALALAALYIDKLVGQLKNATGIRYEIPAVTSVVNLRALMKNEIKRVGVIYRSWMREFVADNRVYCEREGIELIGYEIDSKANKLGKKVKKGIRSLAKENVDAIWVVNDNALLNGDVLSKGWIPALRKLGMPVIVGVRSLVQTQFRFGSYAIIPDHYALGVQGASAIAEIMDAGWSIQSREIEHPLSVQKIVNLAIFNEKNIEVHKAKLAEIDEVIE